MTKTKQYIIVANWKMHLDFLESVLFCTVNKAIITRVANKHKIIFLPSFIALSAVSNALQNTGAFFGAQNCSEFDSGAYTGEISAKMLAELTCSYCLIGHQERRVYFQETDGQIAKKFYELLDVGIIPILCFGEPKETDNSNVVKKILEKQLNFLANVPGSKTFLVAYEPGWAIRKNTEIFDKKRIENIQEIAQFLALHLNFFTQAKLLYGGSVNQHTIQALLNIEELDGFLIGKASTNFAEFQAIANFL